MTHPRGSHQEHVSLWPRLVGIGLPLLGGFVLMQPALFGIVLVPTPLVGVLEIAVLAGVGGYLLRRWSALVVVPLALVGGTILGLYVFLYLYLARGNWEIIGWSDIARDLVMVVWFPALVGCALGVLVKRAKGEIAARPRPWEVVPPHARPLPVSGRSGVPPQTIPQEAPRSVSPPERILFAGEERPPVAGSRVPLPPQPSPLVVEVLAPPRATPHAPNYEDLVALLAELAPAGTPLSEVALQFKAGLEPGEQAQFEQYWQTKHPVSVTALAEPLGGVLTTNQVDARPTRKPAQQDGARRVMATPAPLPSGVEEGATPRTPEPSEVLHQQESSARGEPEPRPEPSPADGADKHQEASAPLAPEVQQAKPGSLLEEIRQQYGLPPPYQRKAKGR